MTDLPAGVGLVTTEGTFELDGGCWEVTNNIWLVGNDDEAIVVDAAHDHRAVAEALAGRKVLAIVLTHGHNDHINAAVVLREAVRAPVYLHPADRMLWDAVHPGTSPDADLEDGLVFNVGGGRLEVRHTPGHSPGSCCLLWFPLSAGLAAVFSGDTLFCGGPGATARSFSDGPTILRSIRDRLLGLPPATTVLTGHGPSTTIGAETAGVQELVAGKGLVSQP
jgi:glyoxylase-like metal-dependent hydrolase (beta-lactamase superfamily II)